MDDFTPQIVAQGGEWSETEINGNQAIVRVRADSPMLVSLRLAFRALSDTEASFRWTPTRSTPSWDDALQQIVFQPALQQPCKPLSELVQTVPTIASSPQLLALIGLWSAVGFGEGWRLPWETILQGAMSGYPPIWGGAFPTTSVIDDFNRADQGPPPSANWSSPILVGDVSFKVVSNQIAPSAAGTPDIYWNVSTFGPDSEVFTDIPTMGTADVAVLARVINPGTSSADGYVSYAPNGTSVLRIYRIDNGVLTQLGADLSTSSVWANGDSLGGSVSGTVIEGFRKPSGGSWTSAGTRTDSTYTGAGNIGIAGGNDAAQRLDNFGGGAIAIPYNRYYAMPPSLGSILAQ